MAARVENQLKSLPAKPGVYLFRDADGDVLYVGKAKSLRPRVRSYFQKTTDGRAQIRSLPARVADVEVIVTGSEVEALHLEQNLVKRHRPPFNVRLRDDKSFPYIAVTVEDDYPRVMFTRERHRSGAVEAVAASAGSGTRRRWVRRSTCSAASSRPGPARGRGRAGTPGFPASTTTSSAAWPRVWATSRRRPTARSST